jgi:small subunit ribosomal protein S8
MAITDPIADMLTRIRNAAQVRKTRVVVPASKLKIEILRVLKGEGYISDFEVEGDEKTISVVLDHKAMHKIIRVSKPGRRVYAPCQEIPVVLQGHGTVILSTSKGVMTGREAKKNGLGGEVLCKVW